MNPLGPIGFVYTVSKDLYSFCMIAKGREDELKALRAQLLSLREKSGMIEEVLKREGVKSEDKSKVTAAVVECETAAKRLEESVAKFKRDDQLRQGLLGELKAGLKSIGRKAAWPVMKPGLETPAAHLNTCHESLNSAISVLHLDVGITSIEHLQKLDKAIMDGKTNLDRALEDMKSAITKTITQNFQRVHEQIAQQTKLIADGQSQAKAEEIVETLCYAELLDRGRQIDNQSPDTDYAWLLTSEAWGIPEALSLVKFLHLDSGIFWITGDAASGKSSLMYYLSKPWHRERSLWQWSGCKELTIACHYCWIAGSPMQKSQQALLQSLLYYVLLDNVELVPRVCQQRWETWPSKVPWSIRELWHCLEAAIETSRKRLCLFVDGLDEFQPERDHRQLVEDLKRLAAHSNVKIIVSSRPWNAFENLSSDDRTLNMSAINTKAIFDYLKKKMSSIEVFADVSWTCLNTYAYCECRHSHGPAHDFVRNLRTKADGNFLWISIVANRVFERLMIYSNNLSSVRDYVDKVPDKVEDLFQDMILRRRDDETKPHMAMALWLALLPTGFLHWIFYWLLSTSDLSCALSIMGLDAHHAKATAYHELTNKDIRSMKVTTKNFLDYYCRDLLYANFFDLTLPDMHHHTLPSGEDKWHVDTVPFRHRMISDYCRTQEVQDMLTMAVPPAFRDEFFELSLLIIALKYHWTQNELFSVREVTIWLQGMGNRCVDLSMLLKRVVPYNMTHPKRRTSLVAMIKEAERTVSHYLEKCFELEDKFGIGRSEKKGDLIIGPTGHYDGALPLGEPFSRFGLFSLTDAILNRRKLQPLIYPVMQECFRRHLVHLGYNDAAFMRRLLAAGADPNEVYYYEFEEPRHTINGITPWCDFLRHLVANETHLQQPGQQQSILGRNAGNDYINPDFQDRFSSVQTQSKIKDLLEFGAELVLPPMTQTDVVKIINFNSPIDGCLGEEDRDRRDLKDGEWTDARLDPLATLRSYLPMSGDSDWPRLLESYLEPGKRQEDHDGHLKIPGQWPKD